ncbi:MAG: rhomboid family intramembrane serine protease [Planctomycetota bacterium]|nr:rhomboid family intramembrane serine protease [Planctomycetota bacterium]
MFIPLGTDRPLSRVTRVTPVLLALNVAVGLVQVLVDRSSPGGLSALLERFALEWAPLEPWRFVTYAFLHGSVMHLLGNMLFLWVFGQAVEDRLGRIGFVVFYLMGAGASGLAHVLTNDAPVIGASGAVSALGGAFLVLFPRTRVRVLFLLFIITVFNVPSVVFIAFNIARDLLLQGMEVIGPARGGGGGVAYMAHLGGYAFGFAVALALLAFKVLPREPFDLFHIFTQKRRLAEIQAAARAEEFRRARVAREGLNARRPFAPEAPAVVNPATGEDIFPANVAALRAQIASDMARGEFTPALEAYRVLLRDHAAVPRASILSRRLQLDVANALLVASDAKSAATAYYRFLDGYPRDREVGPVKVMLALLVGRQLGDPNLARSLLSEALSTDLDEDHANLARALTQEFAPAPSANTGNNPA